MRNVVVPSFKAAVLTLAVSALLLGCTGSSSDSHLAKARTYMDKKDEPAAIIELKNALQIAPDVAETRFLLGKALLLTGNPVAAEVEFGKALDLKYPAVLMAPYRAQGLMIQNRQQTIIDQYADMKLDAPKDDADLHAIVAQAYISQNALDPAKAQIERVLAEQPGHPLATLLAARLQAMRGDLPGAEQATDKLIAADPNRPDTWKLKGDLALYGRLDRAKAIEAYRAGAKLPGASEEVHAALIATLFDDGNYAAAQAANDAFGQAFPKSLEHKYFLALAAYHAKDFDKSRQLTQEILAVLPDNPKVQYLAGTIELQFGALQRADSYAGKVLQVLPDNLAALKLQTEIRLRAGATTKVIESLKPIADKLGAAPDVFAMLGRAYLATGNVKDAQINFERALKDNPTDVGTQTSLALTHLSENGGGRTIQELGAIAARSQDATADLAIINIAIQRADWPAALAALDAVDRKEPTNPIAPMLRGQVENARGNATAAIASFERALKQSPNYFPAIEVLASIDVQKHDLAAAQARFDKVLAADPKNVQALLAVAQLRVLAGDKPEVVDGLITNAIRLNPTEPVPRVLLVNRLLAAKQASKALSAAQDALAVIPDNPGVLEVLGRAQQASGDPGQAIASFNRLAEVQPTLPDAQLRLAEVFMSQNRTDAAVAALKKALVIAPDSMAAQRGLVSIAQVTGDTGRAVALSRSMQQAHKNSPLGYALEGEILAGQKDWNGAIAAYSAGLKQGPFSVLAVKLHGVLLAAGRAPEAERMSADWLRQHPQDDAFMLYLADNALARKDYAASETRFRQYVALQPNNVIALNNLASLTARLGKPGALDYAQKAQALAPDNPAVLDTLAGLLADNNQLAKALDLQKQAVKAAPDQPALRLNLARIMIKSGDKSQARSELQTLAKLGPGFSDQAAVTQLLATL